MMARNSTATSPSITRRTAIAALGSGSALALAGCTSTADDGLEGSITIKGSSTVFPVMTEIGRLFEKENPGVSIDVASTGSGGGFANFFCEGDADINNASRPIKDEEKSQCENNGVDWVELTVATDALTVVVNNDNSFLGDPPCMTVEELAQVWEADGATTWSDVNSSWPDKPIDRFGPADTSGTYDYFIENVQGTDRGHTDDYEATEEDNTIVQGVRGSDYGIGYFGFAYYYQNPDQVAAVSIDNGNGCVEPSLDTAAAGEYQPLSRSLYTYPSMEALGKDHVVEFVEFVLEKATDESLIAEQVGYVPLTESKQEEQKSKLQEAIDQA